MSLIASRRLMVDTASKVSPLYRTSYSPCRFDGNFTPSYMGNYIVRSGFFGEASMRQTGRRYRGSTPYNGARVQKFRRVQCGSVIHHNIASRQSRTTAFLFFFCSLQEATLVSPQTSSPLSQSEGG